MWFFVHLKLNWILCGLLVFSFSPVGSLIANSIEASEAGVITSFPEMRSRMRESPAQSFPFDIKVRLTFVSPGWNRFRVQNEGLGRWCTIRAELQSVVEECTIGDQLRIRGHIVHQGFIQVDDLEFLAEGLNRDLTSIPVVQDGEPQLWRYVEYEGTVESVFESPSQIQFTFRDNGLELCAKLHTTASDPASYQLAGKRVKLWGYLEKDAGFANDPFDGLRILMMSRDQLQIVDQEEAGAKIPEADILRDKVVLFQDSDHLILDGYRLSPIPQIVLSPGDLVDVSLLSVEPESDGEWSKQASAANKRVGWMHLVSVGNTLRAKETTPEAIVQSQAFYQNATLESTVDEILFDVRHTTLRLSEGGVNYIALFPAPESVDWTYISTQRKRYPVGSRIKLTGVVDAADADYMKASFLLRGDDLDKIQILVIPLQWTLAQLKWAFLLLGGILIVVLLWQFSLRRQVLAATQELRSLNARVSAATRAVRDGILVFDLDRKVSQTDEDLERIIGESIDLGVTDAIVLRTHLGARFSRTAAFNNFWQAAFDNPALTKTNEFETVSPAGWLSVYTAPVFDDEGVYFGRIWTFDDITQRKRFEEECVQSQKIRAIGRLAGGVAHDFNNLLHVIGASLDQVVAAPDSSTVAEPIAIASAAVKRASDITHHLLTFSRRSTLSKKPIQVTELIDQVAGLMRSTLGADVDFRTDVSKDLWPVEADAGQIEQVLINLCLNARDALRKRPGLIRIQAENSNFDQIGQTVKIRVCDNGGGIPHEMLDKIFEPFFTTKEIGEGTGLGLATALGVIEQHGGRIFCESVYQKGTEIVIHLPKSDKPAVPVPVKDHSLASEDVKRPKRVLLIDDDDMVLRSTSLMLQRLHHDVVCAIGGQAGLELLSADKPFDVVMLDLTMPEMSGLETLEAIRKQNAEIPVIICSGYSEDAEQLIHQEEMRPDAFLAKPFRSKDLREILMAFDSPK